MLKDYFLFAWKSLLHKKLRSWLTLLGIFIGVASVVSLILLGNGLKEAVNSQFGISSTEVVTVQAGGAVGGGPPGSNVVNPLTIADSEAIEDLSSVKQTILRVIEPGKLEYNDIAGFGVAMSLPDGEKRQFGYDVTEFEAEYGRLLKDGDRRKTILGHNFGKEVNGFGKAVRTGDSILLNDVEFEVTGILKKKGSFIFDNIVALNEEDLRDIMSDEDQERVDVIAIQVKDPSKMDATKEDIQKLLRKRRGVREGEEDFRVQTPDQALSTVNSILTGIQIFVFMIALISVFVGAIGIVNTMTTSVLERKQQIGIMKAIGAKNSDIFFQFFIESGLMGLMGGIFGAIAGTIIGLLGNYGISILLGSKVNPTINFVVIFITLAGSFIIGSIAGIVPAMNAAKQKPVDSLRG